LFFSVRSVCCAICSLVPDQYVVQFVL